MQWHGRQRGQVVLLCGHRTGNGTLNEREMGILSTMQCNTNTQQSTATAGIVGTHNQQCREQHNALIRMM